MTTGAQGLTTMDELQLRFYWRRRSCWRTFDPQGSYAERGRPRDDHWSSRSDDRGRASTSFLLEEELLEDL